VAHGKTTVVRSISGVKTIRFKSELVRNITIKLGYANAKIYCSVPGGSEEPGVVYESKGSSHPDTYALEDGSGRSMHLVRHVSFVGASRAARGAAPPSLLPARSAARACATAAPHRRRRRRPPLSAPADCPGHDILMATMLNGAAVMDAALLLIAGNEPCPQPQTSEHLAAVEIMQLKNIIILQVRLSVLRRRRCCRQPLRKSRSMMRHPLMHGFPSRVTGVQKPHECCRDKQR